jgi:integrase
MTVRVAIENYVKHRTQTIEPLASNQVGDYQKVAGDWENFRVSDIRNEDVAHYIYLLLKTPLKYELKRMEKGPPKGEISTYAKATVRKFIYAMKIALEWHARNGKVTLNPFAFDFDSKTMPGAWEGHRERRLNDGEEEKLYAAGIERGDITYTPADWRALLGFALESAMRQQELAYAEWKQIVADGYKLNIPAHHSKTNTARTILLSKRAREIIELQRTTCPANNMRIFHQFTSAGAICDSFAKLTVRAGIENLTFRDLRHEATSRLCESGKLSQMAIMEMTGHSSMKTFKGYVHLISHENKLRLD